MSADDLAAWLLEQIAEDERVVQSALKRTRSWKQIDLPWWRVKHGTPEHRAALLPEEMLLVAWDPDRLLAECDSKRRMVARHTQCDDTYYGQPCDDLRDLASVYEGRPGYRPEWRPE